VVLLHSTGQDSCRQPVTLIVAEHYEAQQDVMQYITMWYNSRRLHSYLGNKSPNQFEMEMQTQPTELQNAS